MTAFGPMFVALRDQMLSDAIAFATQAVPFLGAVVGIALGGYALWQLRKFAG